MKNYTLLAVLLIGALHLHSCKDDDYGTLVLQGVTIIPETKSQQNNNFSGIYSEGNNHAMHTSNLEIAITEIWVSQQSVLESVSDNFQWYSIGKSSGLKFVEELEFTATNLPAGEYRSIRIEFANSAVRHAVYASDTNQTVLMASAITEASCPTDSLITQYFSGAGSFEKRDGIFSLMSRKEYVRGFIIKPNEVTHVYWMLGFPGLKMTDCSFVWHDENNNRSWDCGFDHLSDFNCIVEGPMWSFSVDNPVDDLPVAWEEEEEEEDLPKFEIDTNYQVTDIIGNRYKAVKIGSQVWMAENLRTNRLNDSTFIINLGDQNDWQTNSNSGSYMIPAQSVYNNDASTIITHGRFYNWQTVSTNKLCPAGWHVPNKDEWSTLLEYLGKQGDAAMFMRKEGAGWTPNGSNESNFNALPSGFRHANGNYLQFGNGAYWWSSTQKDENNSYYLNMPNMISYHVPFEEAGEGQKGAGMSVRCVRD